MAALDLDVLACDSCGNPSPVLGAERYCPACECVAVQTDIHAA